MAVFGIHCCAHLIKLFLYFIQVMRDYNQGPLLAQLTCYSNQVGILPPSLSHLDTTYIVQELAPPLYPWRHHGAE